MKKSKYLYSFFETIYNLFVLFEKQINVKNAFHEISEFHVRESSLYGAIPRDIREQSIDNQPYRHYFTEFDLFEGMSDSKMSSKNEARHVEIYASIPRKDRSMNVFYLHEMYRKIYLIVSLLHNTKQSVEKQSKCSKRIRIFLVLTKHKKVLPKSPQHEIDTIHCNTAFTYSCKTKNEIVVFREEEWCKVLIHELFHTLGLDFSMMTEQQKTYVNDTLKKMYPGIDASILDLGMYETYCETMAQMIHGILTTYMQVGGSVGFPTVYTIWHQTMEREIEWSMFQCVKILNFYNLTYVDLLTTETNQSKYYESKT